MGSCNLNLQKKPWKEFTEFTGESVAQPPNIKELRIRELSDITNDSKLVGNSPKFGSSPQASLACLFHDLFTNLVEPENFQPGKELFVIKLTTSL